MAGASSEVSSLKIGVCCPKGETSGSAGAAGWHQPVAGTAEPGPFLLPNPLVIIGTEGGPWAKNSQSGVLPWQAQVRLKVGL